MFLLLGLSPSLLSRNAGVMRANRRSEEPLREPGQEVMTSPPAGLAQRPPLQAPRTARPRLTGRRRRVLEQLVELAEEHDHGQRVGVGRGHLLRRHQRPDAKLSSRVQGELGVALLLRSVQGVKVTEDGEAERRRGGGLISRVPMAAKIVQNLKKKKAAWKQQISEKKKTTKTLK